MSVVQWVPVLSGFTLEKMNELSTGNEKTACIKWVFIKCGCTMILLLYI